MKEKARKGGTIGFVIYYVRQSSCNINQDQQGIKARNSSKSLCKGRSDTGLVQSFGKHVFTSVGGGFSPSSSF